MKLGLFVRSSDCMVLSGRCVCVCVQLVSSFQTEAQNRTVESDQAKQKLSSLRRMIARLLKSINDVSISATTHQ